MKKQSFIEYKLMEDKFTKPNHFKMSHKLIQWAKSLEQRDKCFSVHIESCQEDLVFQELLEILKQK
jgi:hypothetical protein